MFWRLLPGWRDVFGTDVTSLMSQWSLAMTSIFSSYDFFTQTLCSSLSTIVHGQKWSHKLDRASTTIKFSLLYDSVLMSVTRHLLSVLLWRCHGSPSLLSRNAKCEHLFLLEDMRHCHQDKCAKLHRKPTASRTLLLGDFIVPWTLVNTIPRSCRNILRKSSIVYAKS